MLKAKYRLVKKRDFQQIRTRGKSVFSNFFRLRFMANQSENSRFAVVVSVKVSKKATGRNRLRRQVNEILRLNLAKIKPNQDIVIFVNNRALEKKYQELKQDLFFVLTKAKLIK